MVHLKPTDAHPSGYAPVRLGWENALEFSLLYDKMPDGTVLPAGRPWEISGSRTGDLLAATAIEIGPGWTSTRTLPTAMGTISVTRDAADNGVAAAVVVGFLDADLYHRSAVFVFAAGGANTVTAATGAGTGDIAGQTVSAIRVLDATWAGAAVNAGALTVSIGENVQVRIGAGDRVSRLCSWTVPRGQMVSVDGYELGIDTGKSVSALLTGSLIDFTTYARFTVVRARSVFAERVRNSQFSTGVSTAGVNANGQYQTGGVDLSLHAVSLQNQTGTAIEGLLRGRLILNHINPDPRPELIPWVRARINRVG